MTVHRIHATARPMTGHGPVQPMDAEQARFWELRRKPSEARPEQPRRLAFLWRK